MYGQLIAVLSVLILLAAMLWLLRRKGLATVNLTPIRGRGRQKKIMQVIERVPLTPHHSLHLIQIQDRVLLIGVSPSGCTQLETFAHGLPVQAGGAS